MKKFAKKNSAEMAKTHIETKPDSLNIILIEINKPVILHTVDNLLN